jgi:hypothetical protein
MKNNINGYNSLLALGSDRKASVAMFGTWFASDESKLEKRVCIESLPRHLENLQDLLQELKAHNALKHSDEIKSYLASLSPEQIKALTKES